MNVLQLFALVIFSLSSSSQESARRPKTPSSKAHPVIQGNLYEAQQFNATETLDIVRNKIETFCMVTVFVVLFFIFVAIAAVLEYKSRKSFKLADNQRREGVELVSMRAIENEIVESAV